MKWIILLTLLGIAPAIAEDDKFVQGVQLDWQAAQVVQKHALESTSALLAEYQRLKTEACKPGDNHAK